VIGEWNSPRISHYFGDRLRKLRIKFVNVALGEEWVDTTARLLDSALTAGRATEARLVFPGNVWIYGRGVPGDTIPESRAPARARNSAAPASPKKNAFVLLGCGWQKAATHALPPLKVANFRRVMAHQPSTGKTS
jgi:hypothetical protein